jgi:hypothetical protein
MFRNFVHDNIPSGYRLGVDYVRQLNWILLFSLMKTGKKKSKAFAGVAFVNRNQVLGGVCNWEIDDMCVYHNFFRNSKVLICWETVEKVQKW